MLSLSRCRYGILAAHCEQRRTTRRPTDIRARSARPLVIERRVFTDSGTAAFDFSQPRTTSRALLVAAPFVLRTSAVSCACTACRSSRSAARAMRLPPVVAWQLDDPSQQPVETEPLTEREVQLGHLQHVNPGLRRGLLDCQCRVRRRQRRDRQSPAHRVPPRPDSP